MGSSELVVKVLLKYRSNFPWSNAQGLQEAKVPASQDKFNSPLVLPFIGSVLLPDAALY